MNIELCCDKNLERLYLFWDPSGVQAFFAFISSPGFPRASLRSLVLSSNKIMVPAVYILQACDIKDLKQNIEWTVPEGGGGPGYSVM